jgi:hypothetical protein
MFEWYNGRPASAPPELERIVGDGCGGEYDSKAFKGYRGLQRLEFTRRFF